MHSNAIQKKARFQLYSNNFSLKQLFKNFVTNALEYKAILKFKNTNCTFSQSPVAVSKDKLPVVV